MRKISQKLSEMGIKYERFEATDGSKLSDKEINDFAHPICRDFLCSKGMIGCGMSHYRLWKKQIQNNQEWMFILEDDAVHPVHDIADRLEKIKTMITSNKSVFDKPSLVYLTCLIDCYNEKLNNTMLVDGKLEKNWFIEAYKQMTPILTDKPATKEILRFNDMKLYQGRFQLIFQAYLINLKAAKQLVHDIEKFGFKWHIDIFATINPNITTYSIYKPLFMIAGNESTLNDKYSFPQFPSHIGGIYDDSIKWALNEIFIGNITTGILIYIIFFSILWIFNYKVRKWFIGLLLVEFILFLKSSYLK